MHLLLKCSGDGSVLQQFFVKQSSLKEIMHFLSHTLEVYELIIMVAQTSSQERTTHHQSNVQSISQIDGSHVRNKRKYHFDYIHKRNYDGKMTKEIIIKKNNIQSCYM